MPVTKPEQMMLIQIYGDEDGQINVRSLLIDAGLWSENFNHSSSLEAENVDKSKIDKIMDLVEERKRKIFR